MKKFDWTLVSTMPGSEGYKISGLSANGNGFAVTDAGGNFNVHAAFNTQGSTPTVMKKIVTGLKNQFREEIVTIDMVVCLGAIVIAIAPTIISKKFHRWQGALMLLGYAGYVVYNPNGLVGLSQIAGKYKLYKE